MTNSRNVLALALLLCPIMSGTTASAASLLTTNTLSENTTGALDSIFTGAPDDVYLGIGGQVVEYDFGDDRIVDGSGGDVNVYEVDFGAVEFSSITVSASLDGATYFDITSTIASVVAVDGDDAHSNASFAKSYDLSGSLSAARFIRIDGNGTSTPSGCCALFDLDAVGAVNYELGDSGPVDPNVVPLPAGVLLLLTSMGGLALARRRIA